MAGTVLFILETPGVDQGWDAVNLRPAWSAGNGAIRSLVGSPLKAFLTRVDRRGRWIDS